VRPVTLAGGLVQDHLDGVAVSVHPRALVSGRQPVQMVLRLEPEPHRPARSLLRRGSGPHLDSRQALPKSGRHVRQEPLTQVLRQPLRRGRKVEHLRQVAVVELARQVLPNRLEFGEVRHETRPGQHPVSQRDLDRPRVPVHPPGPVPDRQPVQPMSGRKGEPSITDPEPPAPRSARL
jgi:hypothetical protein